MTESLLDCLRDETALRLESGVGVSVVQSELIDAAQGVTEDERTGSVAVRVGLPSQPSQPTWQIPPRTGVGAPMTAPAGLESFVRVELARRRRERDRLTGGFRRQTQRARRPGSALAAAVERGLADTVSGASAAASMLLAAASPREEAPERW